MNIPYNKPCRAGLEREYILQAIENVKLSGDGPFNRRCADFLKEYFGSNTEAVYITPSCTAASEMASIILNIEKGDEVIMPSFTFTSTANAVAVYGGIPVFIDIRQDTMNIDENLIEQAITPRTKAIAPVHYAGVGCEMDSIMAIARKYNLMVVEDNAQGLFSYYKGKPLGSFGDMSAVSFHETKNIVCGEGGGLCVNSPNIKERAEIIREKGTDRSKFFRGEVDKYSWIDKGSSYLLSELGAAYLLAQLEKGTEITKNRLETWNFYDKSLKDLENKGFIRLPKIPHECNHNAHIFYILTENLKTRESLREYLKSKGITAVSHYIPLHSSKAGLELGRVASKMDITDNQSEMLLRLPLYYNMSEQDRSYVIDTIKNYFVG